LVKDQADFYPAQVPFLPSQIKSLGYFPGDLVQRDFQWWMDDFLWLGLGIEAWRGEYSGFNTYLTTHLYKQVIGRMDASVGGCLWAGPSRTESPYADGVYTAGVWTNLTTTWSAFFTATNSTQGTGGGWPGGGAFTCPDSGLVTDGPIRGGWGSSGNSPTSLIGDAAGSAAIGDLLGIPNSGTIYRAIRNKQYNAGCVSCGPRTLSFTAWSDSAGTASYPEWAFGPLGAAQ
jgi:hypothetical protein